MPISKTLTMIVMILDDCMFTLHVADCVNLSIFIKLMFLSTYRNLQQQLWFRNLFFFLLHVWILSLYSPYMSLV